MAIYLGSDKVKVALGGTLCNFNLFFVPPTIEGVCLISSDGFVLKDSNGLYLTVKECE